MKINLRVEFEMDGYDLNYDFETQRPELFGFLIAELEEDDNYFLISVDDRFFVSCAVMDIVWFLEANLKNIDELIKVHGKSPEFDSAEMKVYIESCETMGQAYDLAKTLSQMQLNEANQEEWL